ncbi:MAG: sigma-E processing peptidase SpoIIGA [Defluviitaleaceae bacterium]|nr:sigma-E processing peptidase SpoIIGA [Defluviitaleaceae bacterium]
MQIVLYADMVFLINFIMDFLIFFVVAKLAKKKIKIIRLILGSFVAALTYCILIFTPILRNYYNFFSSLVVLSLGIIVVFGVKNFRQFLKLMVLSHISAFAIGGLSIALFYYTNITGILGEMLGFTIEYFSFKILLTSSCIIYIITKLSLKAIHNFALRKQCFYDISIFWEDKEVSIKTLVDTGNTLCDPITNAPVIVAEYNHMKNILPENFNEFSIFGDDYELAKKFRLIPFKALGTENGVLIGFKPDKINIYKEDKNTITIEEVIVCIANLTLSQKGEYQGLLNPIILGGTS